MHADSPAEATRPVFLLCGGGRTGSTLLQRLLISTGEIMIWGEHGGMLLRPLFNLVAGMDARSRHGKNAVHMRDFLKDGYKAWIPNINPEPQAFIDGCRDLLQRSLGESARQLNYPRWGFKEILYGRKAAIFLERLFPDCSFIFLVRDPADALRSYKNTPWFRDGQDINAATFLRRWAALGLQFAAVADVVKRGVLVRYEDLVGKPDESLRKIAHVTGTTLERFDRSAFGTVQRGTDRPPGELEPGDLELLRDPRVKQAAQALGYTLPDA